MSYLKKNLHPALKYSVFKVQHFLSELAQFQAHSHVGERGREVRGWFMWECSEFYASQEVKAGCRVALGPAHIVGAATWLQQVDRWGVGGGGGWRGGGPSQNIVSKPGAAKIN